MSKLNTGFQVKVIAIFKNIVDKNIKFLYQQIKLVMHFTPTPLRLLLLNLLGIVLIPIAGFSVDVKNFGAKGDGITDDTEAIRDAITGAEDGVVEFPRGSYRITQNIEINFSQSGRVGLVGKGGSTRIIQEAEGPAFRFIGLHDNGTSDPASIAPVTWEKERMPLMEGFEIVGRHENSDGIELRNTLQPVLRRLLIREVRNGIYFTSRNRNVVIVDCHIYNLRGIGVYLDQVNIHQMIISSSHISYCKKGGIKVVGSQIRNFQISGNDVEYNFDPDEKESADIWIDCSEGGVVREGTISSNTIQARPSPGGANIRFTGPSDNSNKVGLWTITGNHISSQEVNILLQNSRGISITGNNLLKGYIRHVDITNSQNINFSGNVIDHNEDYYLNSDDLGGISVNQGRNIILNDNIIDGASFGNQNLGGAILVVDSREVTMDGCHIINPKFYGIQILNSDNVHVSDCIIHEDVNLNNMLSSISVIGHCPGTVIRDNSITKGSKGLIDNQAEGAVVESNISVESNGENK